ncbi:MAG: DUF2723 domain-containing protein [Chloroflexota bacterium]
MKSFWLKDWQISLRTAVIGAALLSFILFLTTLQLHINGSNHPYATDVGEIQNALPRWGTIHYNGYPLYTFIGSLFVTILRGVGVTPAVGASLYSAVWGALSAALLVLLMVTLGIRPLLAALASLMFALSTSIWADASLAEVHTMSMALTFATLFYAVRFGRNGRKRDLYWLAFWGGMVLAHQRAFALFLPAILFWALPHWRLVLRHLLPVLALGLIGPLTYLYLPLRAWMGADWTYSSPGTWQGFWALVFYTRGDLVIVPDTMALWLERIQGIVGLLKQDWPWLLTALGVVGLLLPGSPARRQERLGLLVSWLLHLPVSFIVWEGRVSDALLAVKLPIIAIAAIGVALLMEVVWRKRPLWGKLAVVGGVFSLFWLFFLNRPQVLAITRDRSAFETIALAQRIPPAADGRSQTMMALWGHDYWALTYAQAYEEQFPGLTLVDHDNDFAAIAQTDHLLTLAKTFYQRPVAWWEGLLGPVYLTAVSPEIVEIQIEPRITAVSPADNLLDLGNGIAILAAALTWLDDDTLQLAVDWQALQNNLSDYSIAVHLAAQDPPTGPQDILAQADSNHPVFGWYPTSRWQAGEVVTDHFLLDVSAASAPLTVRVGMYQTLADGSFENSKWLSLPVP